MRGIPTSVPGGLIQIWVAQFEDNEVRGAAGKDHDPACAQAMSKSMRL
jgi:hypothetical protein